MRIDGCVYHRGVLFFEFKMLVSIDFSTAGVGFKAYSDAVV